MLCGQVLWQSLSALDQINHGEHRGTEKSRGDLSCRRLFEGEMLGIMAIGPCQRLSRCEKSFVMDEFRDRSSWIASIIQMFSPWPTCPRGSFLAGFEHRCGVP